MRSLVIIASTLLLSACGEGDTYISGYEVFLAEQKCASSRSVIYAFRRSIDEWTVLCKDTKTSYSLRSLVDAEDTRQYEKMTSYRIDNPKQFSGSTYDTDDQLLDGLRDTTK